MKNLKINLIAHSAIRIENNNGKILYFDPFKLENKCENDADYIFITHPHYDHFSPEDIIEIKNNSTKIIIPAELKENTIELGFNENDILLVKPNNNYTIDDINFTTIPSYNINKEFHKKEFNWVGYIVNIDNQQIYVAGDTDNTVEAQNVKCDIACIPIGGTYTMTHDEAANLIKTIKPKLAIPTHYQTIVGTVEDAYKFKELLNNIIEVKILYTN